MTYKSNNMQSLYLLILVLVSIWLTTGYGAAIGQELCNCQPTLIRTPKISIPKPGQRVICTKIPDTQEYTPVKNACNCVSIRAMPASVARVKCNLMATTPVRMESGHSGGVDAEPPLFGEPGGAFFPETTYGSVSPLAGSPVFQDPPGPNGIDEPAVDPTGNGCCGNNPLAAVAVDPVSLMLAQAKANRCKADVREGRLAFGQVAVPRDALPLPQAVPDINEEGLYALDKAIVELKTCKSRFADDTAALATEGDALLALEDDALRPVDDAGPIVTLPSYADIGYQTESPSCSPLVVGPLLQPVGRISCPVYENTAPVPLLTDANIGYSSSRCRCTSDKSSSQLKCSCGRCSCGKCSY
ncbi:uncharacterized protein LOC107885485 [Acyrthosiphon pisum]|uniref:Uncharacterized protein n=1 Tax=Acyrthosiphon pisum TaxID=7029 RepID=A0A8R2D808_ACYPI|nr:uncharacterized protein LOC107885485 [Acyrthosiphon pisum]|eukprot:XP_016664630.1 PREDICTED: uncharacterized protein LOC107885485 [Acyrthosiphon pisum]